MGNELQAGDIVALMPNAHQFGRRMQIARVAAITNKGLAYHRVDGKQETRAHLYEPRSIALISTSHRHENLTSCRAAYDMHRRHTLDKFTYYDMAYNPVEKGSMVAFCLAQDAKLCFGYVDDIQASSLSGVTGSYWVMINSFEHTQLIHRHLSEVALIQSAYNGLNPALVRDLLGIF